MSAMQAYALSNRTYIIPGAMFGGLFITRILTRGMQAIPPGIISCFFLAVHEQWRCTPSHRQLSQYRIFAERVVLIMFPPVIYKLFASLLLSQPTFKLAWKQLIIYTAPVVTAAAVRPMITREAMVQLWYDRYQKYPAMSFLLETPQQHAQNLARCMAMDYSCASNIARYQDFLLHEDGQNEDGQSSTKSLEQLIGHLNEGLPNDYKKMNQKQLELYITLQTLLLQITQARIKASPDTTADEAANAAKAQYIQNLWLPLVQYLQKGGTRLPIQSCLLELLSIHQPELFEQCVNYMPEQIYAIAMQNSDPAEEEKIVNMMWTDSKEMWTDLTAKIEQFLGKLQEISFEEFMSLPLTEKMLLITLFQNELNNLNNATDRTQAWQKLPPPLRNHILFLKTDAEFKLRDVEESDLYVDALDPEFVVYMKQFGIEQIYTLSHKKGLYPEILCKWVKYNRDIPSGVFRIEDIFCKAFCNEISRFAH